MAPGAGLKSTANYLRLLDWIKSCSDYLAQYANPAGLPIDDVSPWVPLSAELVSIALPGTLADEMRTSLDRTASSPDSDFR